MPVMRRFILSLLFCLSLGHQGVFAAPYSFDKAWDVCHEGYVGPHGLTQARLAAQGFLEDAAKRQGNKIQINTKSSIESITRHAGLYGHYYKVVRKKDLPWHSKYWELGETLGLQRRPYDPQGDPRLFLATSYKLAHYLGFEYVNNHTIHIPSVDTINKRLDRLSARLVAVGQPPILWRFYEQNKVSTTEYFKNLAEHRIPIATPTAKSNWNHFIHDISFHLATVLMPPSFNIYITETAKVYLELLELVKNYKSTNIPDDDFDPIHKTFLKYARLTLAYNLDFASGRFGMNYTKKFTDEESNYRSEIDIYVNRYLYNAHPASELIIVLVYLRDDEGKHGRIVRTYTDEIKAYLEDLQKKKPQWHSLETPETDQALKDIDQRVKAIEKQIPVKIERLLRLWR